jgi:hypothetical protein
MPSASQTARRARRLIPPDRVSVASFAVAAGANVLAVFAANASPWIARRLGAVQGEPPPSGAVSALVALYAVTALVAVVAVVMGNLGLRRIDRAAGRLQGDGAAIFGIMGGIVALLTVAPVAYANLVWNTLWGQLMLVGLPSLTERRQAGKPDLRG